MLALTLAVALNSCLSSMDGYVYHNDPHDLKVAKAYVSNCRFAEEKEMSRL